MLNIKFYVTCNMMKIEDTRKRSPKNKYLYKIIKYEQEYLCSNYLCSNYALSMGNIYKRSKHL